MVKRGDPTEKIYNKYILSLSIIGLIFSFYLIFLDYLTSDYCPNLYFIPACYIVLISFALIIISEFLHSKIQNFIFYIGSFFGITLAVWFSFNEIAETEICPKLFEIPMCYLSLCLFLFIILLKVRDSFNETSEKVKISKNTKRK